MNLHVEELEEWQGNRLSDEDLMARPDLLLYGLDLGSSFVAATQYELPSRQHLQQVNDLCQGRWWWNTQGHHIRDKRMTATYSPGGGPAISHPLLKWVLTDIRVLLVLGFEQASDALMARLSLLDLRSLDDLGYQYPKI